MRYFIDTEFHEDGRIIDLISIGIVASDGREYYAVSNEFNPDICNEFVQEHVLPKLPDRFEFGNREVWKSRKQIAEEVKAFVLACPEDDKIEFWGYFADYDWIVLCQLFGRMVDLPKRFPYYCRDLKQWMDQLGIKKKSLPAQINKHSAISDARWNAAVYDALADHQQQRIRDLRGRISY